jgi:hypothetical protein
MVPHHVRASLVAGLALLTAAPVGAASHEPRVVVLESSADDPAVRTTPCPAGACVRVDIGAHACPPQPIDAHTVIVTGHSLPPSVLGQPPDVIAEAIQCFSPELIVLDTCYGFSLELLESLAATGRTSLVVGPTRQLPPQGLRYDPRLFATEGLEATERARLVEAPFGERLERWRLDAVSLERARRTLDAWDPPALEARLQRVFPHLVRVPLPGTDAVALAEVAPARFRR